MERTQCIAEHVHESLLAVISFISISTTVSIIKRAIYFTWICNAIFLLLGPEWDTLMEVHHEPIEKNYKLLEEIGK